MTRITHTTAQHTTTITDTTTISSWYDPSDTEVQEMVTNLVAAHQEATDPHVPTQYRTAAAQRAEHLAAALDLVIAW